ncbi:hypothetical protein DFS33DRAFT_1086975 [Desarmillaria ectypa]|nr:hypothetical protein DFS33DRAFT_1086975 [Desarmillaria ectypa]
MLWVYFEECKPFLKFSTQFGCDFPFESTKERGSPKRLDITAITIHTLERVSFFVVDAARYKHPRDVSIRHSKCTLQHFCLLPPSSTVPANRGRSFPKTILPRSPLSLFTTVMPIRSSSFLPRSDKGELDEASRAQWRAHRIRHKDNTCLRSTFRCYLEGGGQMYALTAGHCCHVWHPPSPSNTANALDFPLRIQSPCEYDFNRMFCGSRLSFDPCAEEILAEISESECLLESVTLQRNNSSQTSSGFFLDYTTTDIPKDAVLLKNIVLYYEPTMSDMITVSLLCIDQDYPPFDKIGPLPAVDTTAFHYASKQWHQGGLSYTWMESETSYNSFPMGSVTSRGKIALIQSLRTTYTSPMIGNPGESGSLVFTEDEGN